MVLDDAAVQHQLDEIALLLGDVSLMEYNPDYEMEPIANENEMKSNVIKSVVLTKQPSKVNIAKVVHFNMMPLLFEHWKSWTKIHAKVQAKFHNVNGMLNHKMRIEVWKIWRRRRKVITLAQAMYCAKWKAQCHTIINCWKAYTDRRRLLVSWMHRYTFNFYESFVLSTTFNCWVNLWKKNSDIQYAVDLRCIERIQHTLRQVFWNFKCYWFQRARLYKLCCNQFLQWRSFVRKSVLLDDITIVYEKTHRKRMLRTGMYALEHCVRYQLHCDGIFHSICNTDLRYQFMVWHRRYKFAKLLVVVNDVYRKAIKHNILVHWAAAQQARQLKLLCTVRGRKVRKKKYFRHLVLFMQHKAFIADRLHTHMLQKIRKHIIKLFNFKRRSIQHRKNVTIAWNHSRYRLLHQVFVSGFLKYKQRREFKVLLGIKERQFRLSKGVYLLKLYVDKLQRHSMNQINASNFAKRSIVSKAFQILLCHFQDQRKSALNDTTAFKFRKKSLYILGFSKIAKHAYHINRKRNSTIIAKKHYISRLVRHAFYAFGKLLHRKCVLNSIVDKKLHIYNLRLLKVVYNDWKATTKFSVKYLLLTSKFRVNIIRRAYLGWTQFHICRRAGVKLNQSRKTHLRTKYFQKWNHSFHEELAIRVITEKYIIKQQHNTLRKSISTMRLVVHTGYKLHCAENTVLFAAKTAMKRYVLQAWLRKKSYAGGIRTCGMHHWSHVVKTVFNAWAQYASTRANLTKISRKFSSKFPTSTLNWRRKCFKRLSFYLIQTKKSRRDFILAKSKYLSSLRRRAFGGFRIHSDFAHKFRTWHLVAHSQAKQNNYLAKRIREFISKRRCVKLSILFSKFIALFLIKKTAQKLHAQKLETSMQHIRMNDNLLQMASQHYRSKLLSSAFSVVARPITALYEISIAHYGAKVCSHCFSVWTCAVTLQKINRLRKSHGALLAIDQKSVAMGYLDMYNDNKTKARNHTKLLKAKHKKNANIQQRKEPALETCTNQGEIEQVSKYTTNALFDEFNYIEQLQELENNETSCSPENTAAEMLYIDSSDNEVNLTSMIESPGETLQIVKDGIAQDSSNISCNVQLNPTERDRSKAGHMRNLYTFYKSWWPTMNLNAYSKIGQCALCVCAFLRDFGLFDHKLLFADIKSIVKRLFFKEIDGFAVDFEATFSYSMFLGTLNEISKRRLKLGIGTKELCMPKGLPRRVASVDAEDLDPYPDLLLLLSHRILPQVFDNSRLDFASSNRSFLTTMFRPKIIRCITVYSRRLYRLYAKSGSREEGRPIVSVHTQQLLQFCKSCQLCPKIIDENTVLQIAKSSCSNSIAYNELCLFDFVEALLRISNFVGESLLIERGYPEFYFRLLLRVIDHGLNMFPGNHQILCRMAENLDVSVADLFSKFDIKYFVKASPKGRSAKKERKRPPPMPIVYRTHAIDLAYANARKRQSTDEHNNAKESISLHRTEPMSEKESQGPLYNAHVTAHESDTPSEVPEVDHSSGTDSEDAMKSPSSVSNRSNNIAEMRIEKSTGKIAVVPLSATYWESQGKQPVESMPMANGLPVQARIHLTNNDEMVPVDKHDPIAMTLLENHFENNNSDIVKVDKALHFEKETNKVATSIDTALPVELMQPHPADIIDAFVAQSGFADDWDINDDIPGKNFGFSEVEGKLQTQSLLDQLASSSMSDLYNTPSDLDEIPEVQDPALDYWSRLFLQ